MKQFLSRPLLSLFVCIILLMVSTISHATHLRGGYIHVASQPGSLLSVNITFVVFINTSSSVPSLDGQVDFGDGSSPITLPGEPAEVTDLGNDISKATYTIQYTYSSAGRYTVSYTEANRNLNIQNISESINTNFHLETSFLLDPVVGSIDTSNPILPFFNVFHVDQINSMNLTMTKTGNEFYTYFLSTPMTGKNETVDYIWPKNISLNPINGAFSWDLNKVDPVFYFDFEGGNIPEFAFAARIHQYKKINDNYLRTSQTQIDFQILVHPPTDDIIFSGDPTEAVIDQNTAFERSYTSDNSIETDIFADLPDATYNYEISYESNQLISTAKVQINELPDENGPYFVLIRSQTANNIKDDIITIYFNEKVVYPEDIITSTAELSKPQINIFPNPTDGDITFEFPNQHKPQLKVFNIDGKVFKDQEISNGEVINLKQQGTYIYLLFDGKVLMKSGKIIVE